MSEHQCEGWLGATSHVGPPRKLSHLLTKPSIHIVDSIAHQARRQVGLRSTVPQLPLAAEDASFELPAGLPRLAAGPQWFHAPGPGFHRPRPQQEGRIVRVYLAARTRTACCRDGPVACAPALRQRRDRGSIRFRNGGDGCRAVRHCPEGIGIWAWATRPRRPARRGPGLAGDVPTLRTLAAVSILRFLHTTELASARGQRRGLMKLQFGHRTSARIERPGFDSLFTTDKPIIFAFHAYRVDFTG